MHVHAHVYIDMYMHTRAPHRASPPARQVLERANAIFGVGTGEDPSSSLNLIDGPDDDDDGYDYWPDDLVPLGIAIDDAEEASGCMRAYMHAFAHATS